MKRIHEIIIIPGAGHFAPGVFDRGHVTERYCEYELVHKYAATLIDELDNSKIRHRVVNTKKAPGTSAENRFNLVTENSLAIELKIGWNEKKAKEVDNISRLFYGPTVPHKLAAGLADVMGHWGLLYVYGHKRGNPLATKHPGIVIEPFLLNGANADEYAKRIDKLGHDLASFLSEYLKSRSDNALQTGLHQAPTAKLRAI